MSGPVRLNRSKGLAGELLLSAKADKAPAGASRRLLAGAAVGAALAAKSGAAGSLSAGMGSAIAHVVRWTTWKWVVIGLAGAGSVATAKVVLTARETALAHASAVVTADVARPTPARSTPRRGTTAPAPSAAPTGVAATVALAPSATGAPVPSRPAATVVAARTLPPPVRETAPPAPTAVASPAPAPTTAPLTSHLALEIAAIDGAKRTLATGDAAAALAKMDAYDMTFPQGMLAAEAHALRIEALVRVGRRDEARTELARFRTSHPGSPLLESLTRVVGE